MKVELFISDSNSLKHKRAVIKSLKDRINHKFNVSVSEVDDHDKWQKACLGIAAVSADKKMVNCILDKILDFIRRCGEVQIINFDREIL